MIDFKLNIEELQTLLIILASAANGYDDNLNKKEVAIADNLYSNLVELLDEYKWNQNMDRPFHELDQEIFDN